MSPSAHALLSASGAERWMECTPSARLEEQFPDTTSDFAKEGTLAHEIAELKLRKYFAEPMTQRAFNTAMNKLKKHELYQEEMQGYTDEYLEAVKSLAMDYENSPTVTIERKLDFSLFVPEGFGTGDCILLGGDTLNVVDFKYGKGVLVSPETNPQLRLYALGAIVHYQPFYNIKRVKMTVVQPRGDGIKSFEMAKDDLINWGQFEVKPRAKLAFAGEGEFKSGDWCRFCRVGAKCRTRAGFLPAIEKFSDRLPPLLTADEVGDLIARAQPLKSWLSSLEDYALSALLKGESIAGWKAVEGRSNRQFVDIDKAFEVVKASGIDESVLYERKPITLTAVEKLIGKKEFEKLSPEHVIKPPGKPTLAILDDKREPYSVSTAKADFNTN